VDFDSAVKTTKKLLMKKNPNTFNSSRIREYAPHVYRFFQKNKQKHRITEWEKSGLLAESFIRLGKQATIEKKYIIRKLGALTDHEAETVKSILKRIFKL
jgi:hypothetical protein